jgi:hypothetical protein
MTVKTVQHTAYWSVSSHHLDHNENNNLQDPTCHKQEDKQKENTTKRPKPTNKYPHWNIHFLVI